MVRPSTPIMAIAMLVLLVFTLLPCMEAHSPGAQTLSSDALMASAPTTDCLSALANVSDCFSFIQTGSNMIAPDKACCPELAGLLESNAVCLCQFVGQAGAYGVDISRALMLPDACKVPLPSSLNACPPVMAPTPTPGPTSVMSSSTPGVDGINEASRTLVCLAVAMFVACFF